MQIRTERDIEAVASVIGTENVDAIRKALADGCGIWVFRSREEYEREKEQLCAEGKQFCEGRFSAGETWAGWLKRSTRYDAELALLGVPVIREDGYYDPHGNWHSNNPPSGQKNWSH